MLWTKKKSTLLEKECEYKENIDLCHKSSWSLCCLALINADFYNILQKYPPHYTRLENEITARLWAAVYITKTDWGYITVNSISMYNSFQKWSKIK